LGVSRGRGHGNGCSFGFTVIHGRCDGHSDSDVQYFGPVISSLLWKESGGAHGAELSRQMKVSGK